jgi:ubiquinol-cytochrome c reductase cytochrome b subunit
VSPLRWVDERVGIASALRSGLNHVFPKHWSFMLGEIALYCFVVLVLTGTFLALFFEPSGTRTTYHGSYEPLVGVEGSAAFVSAVELSWDVPVGLLMRQIHHWAAVVFLAAIVLHVMRVFFTGAFRRPREINWLVGVGLVVLALSAGFSGYSMLDDLLSGTGLRVWYALILSIPFVGHWAAFLLFGGEFPGVEIISRLFVVHVFVFPLLIGGFLALHMGLIWRQKHTQFPGPGRSERRLVGQRLWPSYTAKTLGLFFAVFAVLAALGGLAQINPVWLYGPYRPEAVTNGAQPDWYLGWVEGALRLFPSWELELGPWLVANPFFPAVLFPLLLFALLAAWPFLEARVTGDRADHLLLDAPSQRPVRTAIGVGIVTLLALLLFAAGNDVFAVWLGVSLEWVVWVLRVVVLVAPPLAALLAYALCRRIARAGEL